MSKILRSDSQTEKILETLAETYGTNPWNWHTRQTPFQVLKALFSHFPSPETLASAPEEEIANLIRPANYYNTKAARIREISRIILEKYSGNTPNTVPELMQLPGVGRKTAACVMVYGFGKKALPVDTHVHRISNRLGLIQTQTPEDSEKELWKVVPEHYIMHYNELMVKHGQTICRPISPLCHECPIVELCDYGSG